MPGPRETRPTKTWHRLTVVRVTQAFDQAYGINQEGADDRGVQALVVEYQHRLVQARLRIHDKPAGAGLGWALALVRRNKPLAMHQRHVQVGEGRHRAATAVGGQPGDTGALQQEGQQFGLVEDARHQLAVLEVVACQGRLVLGEHAVDFVHALVGVVDGLAFTEQGLRDVLQAERGETPGRRTQRLDAVDDQPTRRRGKIVIVARAVFTPLHLLAATPQAQGHRQAPGMLVQHPQVELHQVPADDRVRVVLGEPLVEFLQQRGPRVAVLQVEVDGAGLAVGCAEHVDLALPATFKGNRVQLGLLGGLDVQ